MNIPIIETLQEAVYDEDTKLLSGIILETGLSKNGNFYPSDTITDAANKFVGVKCFIDHQRDGNVGQRSIRDVCGVVEECRAESGKLRALIRISESHDWIASMVNEGILGDVSINALGRTKLNRRDGRVVREVTEISKAYSVDFVTEAAAGGRVGALLRESAGFSEGLRLIENMTLSELSESRPDLVERLKDELPIEEDVDKGDESGNTNGASDEHSKATVNVNTDGAVSENTDGNPKRLKPLLEGVLASRNLPNYITTYLKNHLGNINLNTDTDPEQVIENLVEGHLDYLGGLAELGMIRSVSLLDQLADRRNTAKKSTFRFLGMGTSNSHNP